MKLTATKPQSEIPYKLQWLMFLRVVFTTLLLGSSVVFQLRTTPSALAPSLLILYGLIAGIFLLSFIYALMLKRLKRERLFAFVQISIDTVVVSLIIFVTGSFSSIFSFLYLLIVIYASMFFFRRGSFVVAALCSIQYGLMIDLEYYGFLKPFGMEESLLASNYQEAQVLYKVLITMAACFTVALLSSFLSEQERKTKKELVAMEEHVKRVEKMAAMGELAAGMAHEIKNPLASLAGAIQLLQEDLAYQSEQHRLMQIVRREAERLTLLINDFLLFARPHARRLEHIEVHKFLTETKTLFLQDNASAAKVAIREEYLPQVWIEMDPDHLRQILWNLLLNAVEAVETKGCIVIKMRLIAQRGVAILIVDDGCGISADMITSIFDPFYTTKSNGTGLGLSIVHNILEAYGSRLDVESREGIGTTFTFKLQRIPPPS